jgi:hypothetical protein
MSKSLDGLKFLSQPEGGDHTFAAIEGLHDLFNKYLSRVRNQSFRVGYNNWTGDDTLADGCGAQWALQDEYDKLMKSPLASFQQDCSVKIVEENIKPGILPL